MTFMIALLPAIIGVLIWFGIYREWNATREYKAMVNKKEYKPLGLRIFFILFGIIGQVLYWFMILSITASNAKSKLVSLNHTADYIYRTSEKWLDLHENEKIDLEGIYCFSDEAEPDSFPEYMQRMTNAVSGWYAVVCDENHKPEYVLYSEKEITQEELEIPDKEEQLKILSRLIRDNKEAIGYSHADYSFQMR